MDNQSLNEIRAPDEVVTERLVEDTRCEFQRQMDEAFYLSMQDIENSEKTNKEYEDKIINEYLKENSARKEKFAKLLFDMEKIIKYDKNIKEIHDIIEPVIFSYCEQNITVWETDFETREKIFKTLSTIRTDLTAIELLKIIIKS